MASPDGQAEGFQSRLLLLWLWILVVVLYFAWEAAAYRGLFSYIAEWQFDHLGQDLPTFTFGALTMIFAWPALTVFRRRRAIEDAPGEGASEADLAEAAAREERDDAADAVYAARDYMHFLHGFTVSLLLAAAVALLWTLTLPRLSGNIRDVAVSGPPPAEGPAQLIGTVSYGRIASFSRGILLLRRSELYAPILGEGSSRDQVRYFVEFAPEERSQIRMGASLTRRTGILVRSDLPGALLRLYRYLGYTPAKHYYVLYASSVTIRWPFYLVAMQFLLGALGFFIASLLQKRHVRRRIAVLNDHAVAVAMARLPQSIAH